MAGFTRLSAQVNQFNVDPDFDTFVDEFMDFYSLNGPIEIPEYADYIKTRDYPQTRKDYLSKLRADFLETGTTDDLVNATIVDTFIKLEAYPDEKKPRLINPRCDLFKSITGHIFHAIDEFVYAKLDPFLVKNMTSTEKVDKILMLFDIFGVTTTDFTGQENSIREELMNRVEMRILHRLLDGSIDPLLLRYIMKTLTYRNWCQNKTAGVAFSLPTARMSGEFTTACFNALINIVCTAYCYYKEFYQDTHTITEFFLERNRTWKLLVEGDDGLHWCIHGSVSSHWYTRMGFVVKIEHFDSVDKASFCGQVFNPETRTLTTDISKFILKFGWANGKYHGSSSAVLDMLTVAKAYSYAYTFPQCPVIYPICYEIIKHHKLSFNKIKTKLSELFDPWLAANLIHAHDAGKLTLPPPDINMSDRLYVERTWNMPISVQYDCEEQCTPTQEIWNVPTLNELLPLKFQYYALNQIRYVQPGYEEWDYSVVLH